MFLQEELQKKISDFLAILEFSVQNKTAMGLLDQNLIAQSFMAKFLNIIYGYDLVNLDQANKKSPAVDLGDFYRKVAFQVTSTKGSRKIQESIDLFIRNKKHEEFQHLRFLILGRKQNTYKSRFETQQLFRFDPQLDILDIKDLIQQVSRLSIYNLERLSILIDRESPLPQVSRSHFQISQDLKDDKTSPVEESIPDDSETIVYKINVPLYSDMGCQHLRTDVTGIILRHIQQPGNILAGYSVHPTSCHCFQEGDKIIRVYSRNRVYGNSWYIHPETQEVNFAGESMEVIGRVI